MVHTVEVRRIGADLAETMAEMRAWIDHYEAAVVEIEHSTSSLGTTFRVSFRDADAAKAFARAFNGRIAGWDPQGQSLWTSPTPLQSSPARPYPARPRTAGPILHRAGRGLKSGAPS